MVLDVASAGGEPALSMAKVRNDFLLSILQKSILFLSMVKVCRIVRF